MSWVPQFISRRRHPRVEVPADVMITVTAEGSAEKFHFHVRNISLGGALIIGTQSSYPFKVGIFLDVVFDFGERSLPVRAYAEAVRQAGHAFGIKFVQMDDAHVERLRQVLEKFAN